ncbi:MULTISPECIES: HlyD family efflux transporter periplasmic adaptor subunit [Flavobacterium]|uniref:HlyD family secretion protein n=1 Tax=Flavobacterium TaxID=237 RepID=UPI00086ADC7B|nr:MULTISPECIES: HlyD family efflux transporter periplasmic adaptor subunit [Flavobacterium]MBN9284060.1 HlyD family efflux transporter periplasmic adaptor subunit [Flavobacterium sp.]ODS85557.1 MAG: hemolysin D [Chryseobacterium sp. SCN 40-13]OJV73296.1 MAG: HlyD family secretion protein [Flavobacterium sp. 40-81]
MPQKKRTDLELRSEEVQEILSEVPHWMIRWGNIVILTIIVLLIILAWFIRYPDIITTEIAITTQTPPEKLIARSTGKIEKIFIENRKMVKQHTPLAVIENTANYKDVFLLKSITDSLKMNNSFSFPFEKLTALQLGDISSVFAIFEKDYATYELNKDLQPYRVEDTAQRFESVQLKERMELLTQQVSIAQTELQLKKKELERYKRLYENGVIASQEWETKNIDYLQNEKNIKSLNSQISQIHSSLNELNRSNKTTKINETKDQITFFRNMAQSYNQLKKAISDWELAYVLRASIPGEVSYLQIWKENQTITTGDNVFTVIPDSKSRYIGKVKARTTNSGKLRINQNVNIRLLNYPDREFGIVKGKVKSISLTPDKEGFLLIDVSLPKGLETSYKKKIIFQQEMSGTADIITEDLRLLERLLYQFRDIFKRS